MHSESLHADPVGTFVCQNFGLLLGICIMLIIALYEEDLMALNWWELGRESNCRARTDRDIFFYQHTTWLWAFELWYTLFLGYFSPKKSYHFENWFSFFLSILIFLLAIKLHWRYYKLALLFNIVIFLVIWVNWGAKERTSTGSPSSGCVGLTLFHKSYFWECKVLIFVFAVFAPLVNYFFWATK